MTFDPAPNDPGNNDPRNNGNWGAIGLIIVGLVAALAVIVALLGPTDTQQASNEPAPPPSKSQWDPPRPAQ